MNKLIEVYNNYCKKIDVNRIHEVCFKIDFYQSNKKVDDNIYQECLNDISRYNFLTFFNKLQIIVETYGYEFLTNSKGEYFIKLKLYYPSIKSLLEYKSSMCIISNCTDQVLDFSNFLCPKHLTTETIENYDLINKCFYKRTDDLDNLYENYKKQTDLINYLNSIIDKDKGYFEIKSYDVGERDCRLEINNNIDNLIEIELEEEINALDCLILEDNNSEGSESIGKIEEELDEFFKYKNEINELEEKEKKDKKNEKDYVIGDEDMEDDDSSVDCFDSEYPDDDDDELENPSNIIEYL